MLKNQEDRILDITLKGLVIICGNYGSGKTETAVNLALHQNRRGVGVKIADLDLVNPYFRTREARVLLEDAGIQVVLPERQYLHADLPILAPAVAGMIRQPSELTILDAGGDDVGVIVLAALADHLSRRKVHMLQVINPFRPFTETVSGCIRVKEEIEAASKMKITGLVGNANLMDETLPDHIYKGYDLLKEAASETGLPVAFITACSPLIPQLEMDHFTCPVLELRRIMNPPWKRLSSKGV